MDYEEEQKHYLLAKMVAYLLIPAICLLAAIITALFIWLN